MRLLYVDTGYLLALALSGDRHHDAAIIHFQGLRRSGSVLVTSDAVLGETLTRLRYDGGTKAITGFRTVMDLLVTEGVLRVQESSAPVRDAALDLMEKYDSTALSYADAVGAIVARAVRADAVLGFDNDFRVLGLVLEP